MLLKYLPSASNLHRPRFKGVRWADHLGGGGLRKPGQLEVTQASKKSCFGDSALSCKGFHVS